MKKLLLSLVLPLTVLVLIILLILIFFWYNFYEAQEGANLYYEQEAIDNIIFKNALPGDYSVIAKKFHDHADFKGSYYSKTRDPIAVFKYCGNYYIFLYKLPIQTRQSIQKIIKEDFSGNECTYNTTYWQLSATYIKDNLSQYSIMYKQGAPQKNGSEIFLNVDGENNSIIKKNDSIAIYRIYPGSFSIRYGKTSPEDFYGRITDSMLIGTLPFVVEFFKKGNSIYLILEIVNYNKHQPHPVLVGSLDRGPCARQCIYAGNHLSQHQKSAF